VTGRIFERSADYKSAKRRETAECNSALPLRAAVALGASEFPQGINAKDVPSPTVPAIEQLKKILADITLVLRMYQ